MVVEAAVEAAPAPGLTLIFGGSRSGKSRWAEALATASGLPVLYLATAANRADDPAWCERLERHRRRRPAGWGCVETGAALSEVLQQLQQPHDGRSSHLLLIDSLGTWLSQHLEDDPERWAERQRLLLAALSGHRGPVLLVCEEVGLGVVPATAVGGLFRDRMGELQQALMAQAQASWLVLAGRAINLHALGTLVPPA